MSAFLDNAHFLRPWALPALAAALALWWAARRTADTTRRWAQVIDPALLHHFVVGGSDRRWIAPHDVLLAGCVLAVLAIAGPTWKREPSPFADALPPLMIVLKVAPSMSAEDLAPTRLDRARQKIADLLKTRDGGAAGLIAYSGSAHLVLPPTQDRNVVTAMAGALSTGIMPREGDRLDTAVALAAKVLRDGGQGGSILVVADTVAPGQALNPPDGVPVIFFATASDAAIASDKALQAAVSALDAHLVRTTVDGDDVRALARRLESGGAPPAMPDEAERWQDAGYWLAFPIALLVLAWFRRGWGLST